jgi:hypothetical protein
LERFLHPEVSIALADETRQLWDRLEVSGRAGHESMGVPASVEVRLDSLDPRRVDPAGQRDVQANPITKDGRPAKRTRPMITIRVFFPITSTGPQRSMSATYASKAARAAGVDLAKIVSKGTVTHE